MKKGTAKITAILGVILLTLACAGGDADLSPEVVEHLEAYENLIAEFEPKFAAVRNDPPAFSKVADSYKEKTQAWIGGLQAVAPDPSEEEGRAIKARIDKLNKRALRMLAG